MRTKSQRPTQERPKVIATRFWWGSVILFSIAIGWIGFNISMSRGAVVDVSLMHALLTAAIYFAMAAFAGTIIGETLPPKVKIVIGIILYLFSAYYTFTQLGLLSLPFG